MGQFAKQELKDLLLIQLPENLDAEASQDFDQQSKSWMMIPVSQIAFNFEGVKRISRDFYKSLLQLRASLKKDQKTIYSLNLNETLHRQIRSDGMEPAFNMTKNLNQLNEKKEKSAPSNVVGADFINSFLIAAQKTFEVQCQTKLKVLKPYIKTTEMNNIAIVSVVSLISNGFSGSIALCFSEAAFLKIYENMFGEKCAKISTDNEDAAGELLNIIYGVAKSELNTKGYDFQKALPTVMVGDKIRVRQTGPKPAVVVPFETEAGPLQLEIEFDKPTEGNHV